MLIDTYAEDELVRILSQRYGKIEEAFLINYNVEKLLAKKSRAAKVKENVVDSFENTLKQGAATLNEDDESFESLMSVSPKLEKAARAKTAKVTVDTEKILDKKRMVQLQNEIETKEK
jgi:hypothetical protein